jgi:hypothetical protein
MGAEQDDALEYGAVPVPLIAMNFPAPLAEEILQKLLIPNVQKAQCIVGIDLVEGNICVTVCCFVSLLTFVPIVSAAVELPKRLQKEKRIYQYLIGNVAPADTAENSALALFLDARRKHDRFYLTCGAIDPVSGELSLKVSTWNLAFESVSGKGSSSSFEELKR